MTLDQYKQVLQKQDWHFEFADDGAAYNAGRESLKALRAAQPRLDPLHKLWNAYASPCYRHRLTADEFIGALRAQCAQMLCEEA